MVTGNKLNESIVAQMLLGHWKFLTKRKGQKLMGVIKRPNILVVQKINVLSIYPSK